jgi:hypothetical protein
LWWLPSVTSNRSAAIVKSAVNETMPAAILPSKEQGAAGFRFHRTVTSLENMTANPQTKSSGQDNLGDRWELWVDRGGGFDILQRDRVTIGGPGGDVPADIAVRCAWRSRVATIVRGQSGDAIEIAAGSDSAAQRAGTERAIATLQLATDQWLPLDGLSSGDFVVATSDAAPRLRYQRPSPLSRSAVITVAAPHRLVRPIDSTILFDQTILVGPESFNHVRAESLSSQGWVLFRRDDRWWVRGRSLAPHPIELGQAWRHEDWSMMIKAR